jgi:uncharacterized membrane protein
VAGGSLVYWGLSCHCPVYEAMGVSPAREGGRFRGIRVEEAVTINRPAAELYQFWRNLENLPQIMRHLVSVTPIDPERSHWVARAPLGRTVEWDAAITSERENQWLVWRSVDGADVENAGSVHFEPATGGRGTVVRVILEYRPPAGAVGAAVAKLFGEEPAQQVHEDLRRFKQRMEAGEVPTVEGQPVGRAGRAGRRSISSDSEPESVAGPPASVPEAVPAGRRGAQKGATP